MCGRTGVRGRGLEAIDISFLLDHAGGMGQGVLRESGSRRLRFSYLRRSYYLSELGCATETLLCPGRSLVPALSGPTNFWSIAIYAHVLGRRAFGSLASGDTERQRHGGKGEGRLGM